MHADSTLASIADTSRDAHEKFAFSRSTGLLSQSGGATCEVKTRICDDAGEDFRRLARSLGMNVSELLRIMILTRLYGVSEVARMTHEHISMVAGFGPEKAQA